jgi:hypothetical protein
MSEPTPPTRRWYQFGLGTLFLAMTVFALWLGWELKFVRERQACEARVWQSEDAAKDALPWPLPVSRSGFWLTPDQMRKRSIPFWRRWLGDEPFAWVSVPATFADSEFRDVQTLFPEAFVYSRLDLSDAARKRTAHGVP